jgi:membrane carboxypeptidase/penicillin-binding protein PbpC
LFYKWVARHPAAQRDAELMRLKLGLRSPHELPFRAPHFVDGVLESEPSRADQVVTHAGSASSEHP